MFKNTLTEFHVRNSIVSGNRMPKAVMAITVFLFSMWDFYLPQIGLRLFDLFGIGLLCLWMLLQLLFVSRQVKFSTHNYITVNLLIVWGLFFSILGILVSLDNTKPVAGFLIGSALFVFFYFIKIDELELEKSLRITIILHIFFLLFQFIYYHIYGIVINPYGFLGGDEPRALSSIFRPTGLFLEPAAYSVSMLMLLIVRFFIVKSLGIIDILALLTIYLTLSLWGLIASTIFMFIFARKNLIFYFLILVLATLVTMSIPFIPVDWLNANDSPWIRLMNLGDDSSTNSRFGALVNSPNFFDLIIGKGVGNDYHYFGSSGIAFVMSAGGLLGSSILFYLLFKLTRKDKFFLRCTLIFLCMTAAPIWTTMFWWLWLALMTRHFDLPAGKSVLR